MQHKYIGYGNTTTHEILNCLYSTHANISPSDLQYNDARLRTPYDANHTIEKLTDRVENAVEYAAAGQTMYTPKQVVAIAYQLVFQTGLFLGDCKIWRRKDPADKTWTAFKVLFATSHQEWRESQVTTAGADFQTANSTLYHQDTFEVIANLAPVMASDRAAVADIFAKNSTLATELTACQAKLFAAFQELTKLYNQNSELRRQTAN